MRESETKSLPRVRPAADTSDRPTVSRGTITFDRADYKRLWMDTPMRPPGTWQERAELRPGTCVKTSDGRVCGKVHTNSGAGCIVIGHGWENWDSERFVWRGTLAEFVALWVID